MRLHYLQHVPFKTPAYIAQWAIARGLVISMRTSRYQL